MRLPFAIIGIVGVGDPVGRFARIGGSAGGGIPLLAVAEEVHAVKRLRSDAPGEVDELVRADAIRFHSAPDVIAHWRALRRRPNALATTIVTAEEPSESHGPRRKLARDL